MDERPAWLDVVQAKVTDWQRLRRIEELTREILDPDECRYDHHGLCQAHYLQENPCPVGQLQRLLEA